MDKFLVYVEVTILAFVALGTHTPDDPLTMVTVGHLESKLIIKAEEEFEESTWS